MKLETEASGRFFGSEVTGLAVLEKGSKDKWDEYNKSVVSVIRCIERSCTMPVQEHKMCLFSRITYQKNSISYSNILCVI